MSDRLPQIKRIRYFADEIEKLEQNIAHAALSDEERERLRGMATGAKDAANQLYWAVKQLLGEADV